METRPIGYQRLGRGSFPTLGQAPGIDRAQPSRGLAKYFTCDPDWARAEHTPLTLNKAEPVFGAGQYDPLQSATPLLIQVALEGTATQIVFLGTLPTPDSCRSHLGGLSATGRERGEVSLLFDFCPFRKERYSHASTARMFDCPHRGSD